MPIETTMHPRHRFISASARLLTCALLTASVQAQDADPKEDITTAERPASAGRVVRAFDFEEKDYNPIPVPLGWIRAQEDPKVPRIRPGFPIWNGAVIDYESPAYSGIGTAKLPTQGGSTSLILRHGEINIFPNADYLVSARVRTQDLQYAKARVVARLLDQHGDMIDGAESSTQLVNTQSQWQQVSLEIEGLYPNAAYAQIELQLLQPQQQDELSASRMFSVWDQDYSGAAFFDNLIIAQLPRLEISTGTPGNIVESESVPPLQILVRDLTGDAIVAKIRVLDVHGYEVDTETLADGSRRVRTDWTPDLPGYGWYRAMLQVVVDDQLVGIRTIEFIWLSPSEPNQSSGMFGIHANLTNPLIAQSAPALINGAGVTRASIETWSTQTTLEDLAPESPMLQAIDQMILDATELSIELSELPRGLADALAVDPDEVIPVFAGPSSTWIQWGATMLDQYGQAVSHWRFGNQPTQETATTLNPQLDSILGALSGYVPGPVLVMPWSIDRPIESEMIRPNQQLLIIDNNATNEQTMELIVDDWIQLAAQSSGADTQPGQAPTLGMVLSPMHATDTWSGVEVWSTVGALARKAISFWWAAGSSGRENDRFTLELTDAWWVSPGKRGQVMPAPELVVWRTLATHLGGRNPIEELDLIPGVRMLVAGPKPRDDSDSNGVMILWLEQPSIEPTFINLPLAMGTVTRCDVFNNQTPIQLNRVGELDLPMHQIEIGRTPIIITGVNTQLVRFLSSLHLTPGKLQAMSGIHKHTIGLDNPWPFTIRGRLFVVEPGGYTGSAGEIDRSWEIKPRVFPFVLDAYEHQELPVDIAYSLGEIAGEKLLTFDIELEADTDYPLMRVQRTIELGLEGIEMRLTARKGTDGITIVGVHVTNKLNTDQDFEVIAIPPNEARLRRSINAIKPNEQVTREFAFTKTQSGDQVIVALLLRESSVRLNKTVTIP